MIILMAGLPGTGKSTLALALVTHLAGTLLNKDDIRAALFSPGDIEYSSEQDDLVQELMMEVAGYVLTKHPGRFVFLDGRTFSRRYQIDLVLKLAAALHQPWRILECICSEETARQRLADQAGTHPAQDRNFELYLRVKSRLEAITLPKTVIDTDQPLGVCVTQSLTALEK